MSPEQTPRPENSTPWLSRPQSIRRLWLAFAVVLALTVLAQFFVDLHPHFALEAWFGFNAAYGFVACLAMVVFAKGLGALLKRSDRYYQPADEDGGDSPSGAGAGDD